MPEAGILQALYVLGLTVPHNTSLISYNDSMADMLAPQLASMRQPYNKIAAAVMEVVARAEGPLLRHVVPTRLVHRSSIGAVRP
jgi:DNA-binding LacI/PurR family transcriptional regulator